MLLSINGNAATIKISHSKLYIQSKTFYTLKLRNTKKNLLYLEEKLEYERFF